MARSTLMSRARTDDRARDEWGSGWEARRRKQLTQGLEVSPAKRLEWLEAVIELAHLTGALPRRRNDPWRRLRGR